MRILYIYNIYINGNKQYKNGEKKTDGRLVV